MTKQHGPVLQTQAVRTTKKTILALAVLVGLQAAALAATSYDYGWAVAGFCFCSISGDDPDGPATAARCIKASCDEHYSGQEREACYHGADDELEEHANGHAQPVKCEVHTEEPHSAAG